MLLMGFPCVVFLQNLALSIGLERLRARQSVHDYGKSNPWLLVLLLVEVGIVLYFGFLTGVLDPS